MAPDKVESWDPQQEIRKVVDRSEELRALYKKIGCSPDLKRKSEMLAGTLVAFVRIEIPDFAAFWDSLHRFVRLVENDPSILGDMERTDEPRHRLFVELTAAGGDQESVLQILNVNALWHKAMLSREQTLSGEIFSPIELVVRMRPQDPGVFRGDARRIGGALSKGMEAQGRGGPVLYFSAQASPPTRGYGHQELLGVSWEHGGIGVHGSLG